MWRLYDWECRTCSTRFEGFVDVSSNSNPPKSWPMYCPSCLETTPAERIISKPAKYLGEKKMSPRVSGGSFDTMGRKATPRPPEFKGDTYSDFKDFIHDKKYIEYKKSRAKIVKENAMKKKRAAAMRKDPNLSIRHNPLPGDPSFK